MTNDNFGAMPNLENEPITFHPEEISNDMSTSRTLRTRNLLGTTRVTKALLILCFAIPVGMGIWALIW